MNVRAYFDLVKSQVAMISVLLLLLLPAFGCSGSGQASDEAVATTVSETTSAPITSPPNCDEAATCTTRQLADSAGVTLGAAVAASHLGETDYRTTLLANFNSVTPENELKWATIHPAPGTWNFGPADRIIKFAQENNLQVKGHNLIWDQKSVDSTPDWVLAIDDPIELRSVVTDHIQTVMTRYRGSVDRWDVVNEPLETLGSEPYDNHFRKILGVDYIAEMFAIAHKTNPEARLFLNEATVEFLPDKAAALVAMVKELLDRGEPLDGVGIQAHIVAGTIDSAVLRLLINDLEQLGVEVAITELDVPATASSDPLAVQADTYGQTLSACLEEDCREVTLWGFTDRYTWVDKAFGPGLAPLPFDRDYKPKPALAAIRERISAIPSS